MRAVSNLVLKFHIWIFLNFLLKVQHLSWYYSTIVKFLWKFCQWVRPLEVLNSLKLSGIELAKITKNCVSCDRSKFQQKFNEKAFQDMFCFHCQQNDFGVINIHQYWYEVESQLKQSDLHYIFDLETLSLLEKLHNISDGC